MSLDQELLAQIDKYKEIMQKDPNSREFLRLADLYRKLGVAEEAMKILKDGLKKHPDYTDARLSIARIFLTQGQIEDATREFEAVIQQDTGNFVAYKLLGEIAMQKQEHEKAAERFGSAYKLKPDDQECKVMLDYIGSLVGRDVTPVMADKLAAPAAKPAPAPKPAPPPPAPSKGTIAVSAADEFSTFEEAEEIEEIGEFEEEGLTPFEEAEDIEEVEESAELEPEPLETLAEPEDFEEFAESEPLEDVEEVEEIEDIEDVEETVEELEDMPALEEEDVVEEFVEEEVSALEEEDVVEEVVEEDIPALEEIEEIEEFAEEPEEEEEPARELAESPPEVGEEEEELVAQIFQELSDSQYTSEEGTALESGEGELEDLMGLLDAEESAEIGDDFEAGASAAKPSAISEEENDLESMLGPELEGVAGIDEISEGAEEIEELPEEEPAFEEGFEEIESEPEAEEMDAFADMDTVEEFEEVETLEEIAPEPTEEEEVVEEEVIEEVLEPEEGAEESSIFEDFGLADRQKEDQEAEGGDVFQNFDFDAFEQELLKDRPPQVSDETFDEPSAEEADVIEEAFEEPGEEELEEFPQAEEFLEEEATPEEEVPTVSLAELYIKQDLFDEATAVYRKLLNIDPSAKGIRQMLEETLALQAYIEEGP